MLVTERPKYSLADAANIALELYGLRTKASALTSERDQNFKLVAEDGKGYVLKIAHPEESQGMLEFENEVLLLVHEKARHKVYPELIAGLSGETLSQIKNSDGQEHFVRLISFLSGEVFAKFSQPSARLLQSIGTCLGELDAILANFKHPAMTRFMQWDLKHAPLTMRQNLEHVSQAKKRTLLEANLATFERYAAPYLIDLRSSVIHNDMNDYNFLVEKDELSGIIDFGDMLYSFSLSDLAIACAYIILDKADPIAMVSEVLKGYHGIYPLTDSELELLFDFIVLRLSLSVSISARQQKLEPNNPYLSISEQPAWAMLERLAKLERSEIIDHFKRVAGAIDPNWESTGAVRIPKRSKTELLELRQHHIGKSLSIAYKAPLKIVRGQGQYLYDETGQSYLDCVNNVSHVGHSHPKVTEAAYQQLKLLNTNTRFLHDNIIEYALRLTATLPEPLSVCFFVNSGSEANDLALRLARTHTGRQDIITLDHAYHGHTQSLIDISPYKFNRKGGKGKPAHTQIAPIPDPYRGIHKGSDTGTAYADEVKGILERLEHSNTAAAAFIAESASGCGGQVFFPQGYFKAAFEHSRNAGTICIIDEVQTGFGRAGSHMWMFQTQHGAVPDIVTMGKPAGNGHPLAAVVTTPEIARSFANGMEYFNTFGGNPVSCAIGLAVLDIIEEEGLQDHARQVGQYFLEGLKTLESQHGLIGDVRGIGLFLGMELVKDSTTLEPATEEASLIKEKMRERNILLSTDGPFDNVIKIKPPLVFSKANVDEVIATLNDVLNKLEPT